MPDEGATVTEEHGEHTDHDLLITISTRQEDLLRRLQGYVPERCIDHQARMIAAEEAIEELKKAGAGIDHEQRIGGLERASRWVYGLIAGLILVGATGAVTVLVELAKIVVEIARNTK